MNNIKLTDEQVKMLTTLVHKEMERAQEDCSDFEHDDMWMTLEALGDKVVSVSLETT